jgi:hypothetical protein
MSFVLRSQSQASSSPRTAKTYRHDPYRKSGKVFYFDDEDVADVATPRAEMPANTRHPALWGLVSFVPYPREEFRAPSPPCEEDGELVRVFIGQLPYHVTEMQLAWLCHTFGGGNMVAHPERILKRQPNGEKLPTGCIHAYTTVAAVEMMAEGMHKRMLVDDTGVWHAKTLEEFEELSRYVSTMKSVRTLRVPGRPYDTVVVQRATSTYVPHHVANKPHLAENAVNLVADVVEPRAIATYATAPRRQSTTSYAPRRPTYE